MNIKRYQEHAKRFRPKTPYIETDFKMKKVFVCECYIVIIFSYNIPTRKE